MIRIPATVGALMLGGLFSAVLSGMFITQVILYVRFYPNDHMSFKCLVFFVWALDLVHDALVWKGMWEYFVVRFGNLTLFDVVPKSLSTSLIFASILTLSVNCFYIYRAFRLSNRNWFLTCPIAILAALRFSFGVSTFGEMLHLQNFSKFRHSHGWLLNVTLALSAFEDIAIMLIMVCLLHQSRRTSMSLNRVIDMLILYTLEMTLLTAALSLATMICWLALEQSLIFFALLVILPKLYANSFLATLNSRKHIRSAQSQARNEEAKWSSNSTSRSTSAFGRFSKTAPPAPLAVRVNVERSVQRDFDVSSG